MSLKPNKAGLTTRITRGGVFVCKLHYAADGHKNPATPEGRGWLKAAASVYPGGTESPDWLKEMEIMYSAGSGAKVFPYWQDWLRHSNIFLDGEVDIAGATLYGSYDHGFRNPACYLVHAIYPDDLRRTIWEFYAPEVPVPMLAKLIQGESVMLSDGRQFAGNPYAGKEAQKICDPEIMRDTQVMNTGPNRSIAELFRREGVHFIKGTSGDDATIASWLTGNLWLDPFDPMYQIHRDYCPNLIWEMGRLQRKSQTSLQARTRNSPEGLVDKDNHAYDALKYWLKRFPVGVSRTPRPIQQANFAYWRDLSATGKSKVAPRYVRQAVRKS